MFTDIPHSDRLEAFRVADDLVNAAYEGASPVFRGALKTALALTAWLCQGKDQNVSVTAESSHLGLWKHCRTLPSQIPIIAFTPEYKAAGRLCAAAILPVLAGCQPPLAFCIDGLPSLPALASLDISGTEDIFTLSGAEFENFLRELHSESAIAAIVLLHDGILSSLGSLARALHFPVYEEAAPPRLLAISPEAFAPGLLEFLHGFTPQCGEPETGAMYDAIFISRTGSFELNASARLILPPGTAGFWIHRNLSADFFRDERIICGLAKDDFNAVPRP